MSHGFTFMGDKIMRLPVKRFYYPPAPCQIHNHPKNFTTINPIGNPAFIRKRKSNQSEIKKAVAYRHTSKIARIPEKATRYKLGPVAKVRQKYFLADARSLFPLPKKLL
jgi:hypothetical protein